MAQPLSKLTFNFSLPSAILCLLYSPSLHALPSRMRPFLVFSPPFSRLVLLLPYLDDAISVLLHLVASLPIQLLSPLLLRLPQQKFLPNLSLFQPCAAHFSVAKPPDHTSRACAHWLFSFTGFVFGSAFIAYFGSFFFFVSFQQSAFYFSPSLSRVQLFVLFGFLFLGLSTCFSHSPVSSVFGQTENSRRLVNLKSKITIRVDGCKCDKKKRGQLIKVFLLCRRLGLEKKLNQPFRG